MTDTFTIRADTFTIASPTAGDDRVVHVRAGEIEVEMPDGSLIIDKTGHRLVPNADFTVVTKTVARA